MSIKFRIIIPMLAILVAGVAARTVLVAVRSSATTTELSMQLGSVSVDRHVSQLEGIGLGSYDLAVTLAASIDELSLAGDSRETVVSLMTRALEASYNISGVWTCWEPGAFDGLDNRRANAAPYEDDTGRFAPSVFRTSLRGEVQYAPLTDYNDPAKGDFYQGVRSTGRLYVTDPYEYDLAGTTKLFVTVAAPIIRDGVIVGAAGVDLTLDALGRKMNSERTFDSGTIFAISSTGQIVFHQNNEFLMKNYKQTWINCFDTEIQALLRGQVYVRAQGFDETTGQKVNFSGRRLNFANSDKTWVIAGTLPTKEVVRRSTSLTLLNAISGLVLIAIVVLTVLLVVRQNLKDLTVISSFADKLSAGDIDVELRRVPQGFTKNEIGRLKQSFDRLIHSTKKQVAEVQRIAGGDYAFDITPQSDKDLLNIALSDMAGSLNRMFNQVTEERARAEAASETKSNFLANMSHEMRTPLNAVVGLSELTLGGDGLDGEARDNLEKVYNAGVTLLGLVNDILDLSKIEAGKLELIPVEYDIASLVNDTVTLNIVRIGSKPIQFHLHVDENLPSRMYGDELRIKQIFNNLLSNAFKYTKEGHVDFTLSCERDENGEWLTCGVRDSGIGIKPEDMKKLFSEYNQVDTKSNRKIEGTGLGLSITKRLVELMDGSISVESEYGRGSLFTIRVRQKFVTDVPIGATVAKKLTEFHYLDSKRSRNTKLVRIDLSYARVLVVDDVQNNLDVAKGILKPYGMKIDCVTSGQAAIDLIRKAEVKYDAIFMDHMMPGMDGIEATHIIREEIGTPYAETVPILALTANAILGNEEMFLNNGFQAFLSKPIDILAMDAAIRLWVRDKSRESASDADGDDDAAEDASPVGISVDGLDAQKGLERFGGDIDIYMEILKSYADNTPALLEQVRDVTRESLADYAVTVHGIKGSSRNIGADALGALAEALEHAAKADDLQFVLDNNGAFLAAARSLLESLQKAISDYDAAHPKEKKSAPDADVLEALRSACEAFDIDGVDAAMGELESYEYETGGELVKWLRGQADIMGFAQIAERLSKGL